MQATHAQIHTNVPVSRHGSALAMLQILAVHTCCHLIGEAHIGIIALASSHWHPRIRMIAFASSHSHHCIRIIAFASSHSHHRIRIIAPPTYDQGTDALTVAGSTEQTSSASDTGSSHSHHRIRIIAFVSSHWHHRIRIIAFASAHSHHRIRIIAFVSSHSHHGGDGGGE